LVGSGYDPVQLANDLQKEPYTVLRLEGNELLEYFMSAMRLFLGSLPRELLIPLVKLSNFASEFNVEDASIFFPNAVECRGKLCFLHDNAVLQLDGAGRYSLHPFIQTLCREEQEKMKCAEEGTQAMNIFTYHYFDVLKELHRQFVSKDFKESLQRFYFVKMNIDQAFENALSKGTQEMKERCIDVFNSSINFLGKVLKTAESLKVYKQLYEEAKSMKDNRRMSECLVSLGFTHIWVVGYMGYSKDAMKALEEAISLQKLLPEEMRQTEAHAHGLSKLGVCYYAKKDGDSSKGKELIDQAMELRHQLDDEVLLAAGYCDQASKQRVLL
jgi:tetratricopeptide (TPR) repeat protein